MILPPTFWAKVTENPDTGCWEWTAARARNGYGQFSLDGTVKSAHRLAYRAMVGEIPDGLVIDHLCRVRHCVNPGHMEPVTPAVNRLRGDSLYVRRNGTAVHPSICIHGHALAGPNLAVKPDGRRYCRACYILRRRAKATGKRATYRNQLDLDALLAEADAALKAS